MEPVSAIEITSKTGSGLWSLWTKVIKPAITRNKKQKEEVYLMIKQIKSELTFNGGGSIKDAVWDVRNGMAELNKRLDSIQQDQHVALNLQGLAFWISNEKGECVFASTNLCKLVGRTESEILGNNWIAWVIPEDKERVFEAWQFSIENKSPFDERYTFKKADGTLQEVWGLAFHKKISGIHHGTMGKLEAVK